MLIAVKSITESYAKVLKTNKDTLLNPQPCIFANVADGANVFILHSVLKEYKSSVLGIFASPEDCVRSYNDYNQAFNNSALLLNETSLAEDNYLATFNRMQREQLCVFTSSEQLAKKFVDKNFLTSQGFNIEQNKTQINYEEFLRLLRDKNFKETNFVYNPGEFAVRGNIIDFFSFAEKEACRIVFSNNSIKFIKAFNPIDQIARHSLSQVNILPKANHSKDSILLNFLPSNTKVCIDKKQIVMANLEKMCHDAYEKFEKKLHNYKTIYINEHAEYPKIDFKTKPTNPFSSNFALLREELMQNQQEKISSYVFGPQNLTNLEQLNNLIYDSTSIKAENPLFSLININLSNGFICKELGIAVYTYNQIFGKKTSYARPLNKRPSIKEIKHLFAEIKPGDYVSHIDHGIGKLAGIQTIQIGGKNEECLRIIYADNDLLYLNVSSLHKISKYIPKDAQVKLSKLGSITWDKLKSTTKKKIKEIGRELISLYAKRKFNKGFAFSTDCYLQYKMENSFDYVDTPDQVTAMQDIKRDMEADSPMDRLICGDVGFGKTELAIRAAYKACLDKKQVAVLAPTTLLTMQHVKTFKRRLDGLGVEIDYLNRFKTSKETKQIIEKLSSGRISIIIGTHKILNPDIKFQDLGLLIIDEEQKFGVSAKEKIKNIKNNVDTLTLTATPIPRTLKHSLMGARDISTLNTPPANRQDVKTTLCTFNKDKIKEILLNEIARNGQAYIIHNRVQDIQKLAMTIAELVPEAKIIVGHGQMKENDLEAAMAGFINKDFDILISTTIIESGIDIPNANTIIINNAHMFGLSDLHQMRGRVGRSDVEGYCYLMIPGFAGLTHEATERLFTIEQLSTLGSGLKIAMKDLDIRGAGNILGDEQSGFIADMGLETYNKLLQEAINELKTEEFCELFENKEEKFEYVSSAKIDADEECLIPQDYISDSQERYNIYMRLSRSKYDEDLTKLEEELVDRFGALPRQIVSLITSIKIQRIAKYLAIEKVLLKNGILKLHFINNRKSKFYDSKIFQHIISFALANPATISMEETNKNIKMKLRNIGTLEKVFQVLSKLLN